MYDVCVIGSGAGGGSLAKELAEAGAKVVLVEAGRLPTPQDFYGHQWPYEFPKHVKPTYAPFTPPELREGVRYEDSDSIYFNRIRVVGGQTNYWNAVSLRFAARDFREWSLAGVEEDWPITYQELAPFYSRAEKIMGVTGTREGLEVVPDGEYLKPLKPRCSENIIKQVCTKMGIPMIPARKAVLTESYEGRAPCHYCGHCMEGCDVGAIFSTSGVMIPRAQQTGNFTLLQNKLARELLVDQEGKVRALSVIDTVTRKEEEIGARVFAVCCGTSESARLLLNSRSPRFPNGLANGNDVVGRYLHGNIAMDVNGYLEALIGTPPVNNDGATDHTYIPRFTQNRKDLDFVGGYQFQLQYASFMYPYHANVLKGFGKSFKQQVRLLQPGFVQLGGFTKVLARPENRVVVDPKRKDAYGIPILVAHFRWGENDRRVYRDMMKTAFEIVDAARCRIIVPSPSEGFPEPSGFAAHEVGTIRMGRNPRTSVLNGYCQAHEVKNLFALDCSVFTTYNEKNPVLTVVALACRTAQYIAEQVRKGNL